MRSTEPKDAYIIISEVINELRKKQNTRGNIEYYTPEVVRETTAAQPQTKSFIDYETGDIVQVRATGKRYTGRIGMIIGVRYTKFDRSGDGLIYTVKFSDNESCDYVAKNLTFVRRNTTE